MFTYNFYKSREQTQINQMASKTGKRKFKPLAFELGGRKISKVAHQVEKIIKRREPDEIKYSDSETSATTPVALTGNVALVVPFALIAQGVSPVQRLGARINPKYLEARFSLYQASAAVNANFRVMIVLDSGNTGTLPTATDILETAFVCSAPNIENKERFTILRDELMQVNGVNSSTPQAFQRWHCDLRKIMERQGPKATDRQWAFLTATPATVADVGRFQAYLVFLTDTNISSSMSAGTARSGINYGMRLAYTDP